MHDDQSFPTDPIMYPRDYVFKGLSSSAREVGAGMAILM